MDTCPQAAPSARALEPAPGGPGREVAGARVDNQLRGSIERTAARPARPLGCSRPGGRGAEPEDRGRPTAGPRPAEGPGAPPPRSPLPGAARASRLPRGCGARGGAGAGTGSPAGGQPGCGAGRISARRKAGPTPTRAPGRCRTRTAPVSPPPANSAGPGHPNPGGPLPLMASY